MTDPDFAPARRRCVACRPVSLRPVSLRRGGVLLSACLLAAAVLAGCLPFDAGAPQLDGPPSLRVDFDSISASARLSWQRPPLRNFLRYEVERIDGEDYAVLARIADGGDSTWTDDGLLADRAYRYRVSSVFRAGDDGEEDRLPSTVVEGGIHRFANQWAVSPGLLPTRLLFDGAGAMHVLGPGAGWVERYDRGGHDLGRWTFHDGRNACLETATLDGPAAAFDDDGNLHVVYNVYREGEAPRPEWTRLGPDGERHWTRPLQTVFARHIAIDDGRVYIESISQLQEFTTDGEPLDDYPVPPLMVSSIRFWRGRFVEPLGFDTAGWQSPRLVIYGGVDRSGVDTVFGRDPLSPTDRGAGLLNRPSDFAVEPQGERAFVVNAGADRVEVFRAGRYLTRWGSAGDGPSQFRFRGTAAVLPDVSGSRPVEKEVLAGGIARDHDGFLYVADTFNGRIQKFAP
jgi:hypothetical protein